MTNTSPLGQNQINPNPMNPVNTPNSPVTEPIQNAPVYPVYPVTHEPSAPEVAKPVIQSIPTNPIQANMDTNPITSPLNTVTEPIPFDPSKAQSNTFNTQAEPIGVNNFNGGKPKGKTNIFAVFLIVIFLIALIAVVAMILTNGNKNSNSNLTPTPTITISPTSIITDNTNTDNSQYIGEEINPMVVEIKNDKRLKISTPIAMQVVQKAGMVLPIKGEMKGFFEGVMNFRIVDERYFEIAKGTITAQGDNLVGFAPFEKQFTIPNFADSFAVRGMIEFSETSMKDGATIVISSVPLVFK